MKTSDHQKEIERIFHAALELEVGERREFVSSACRELPVDAEEEVIQLIEADAEANGSSAFLPPVDVNVSRILESSSWQEPILGERIGVYEIVERIAGGGFGEVYLADRTDGIRRRVAIKLLRSDLPNQATIYHRFNVERQVLSDLDHPNIARFFESGKLTTERPYFIMEYVDGKPITAFCKERGLSLRERLRLFQQVCGAVAHAHQFGIIHRDLKPNNILVTHDGIPKLLDFGIAKLMDGALIGSTLLTETGQSPMTPNYASPEQIKGLPISQASDVYSLGALLYELVTSEKPFPADNRFDLIRDVSEKEPVAPSRAIEMSKRAELQSVVSSRQIRGDIDQIVLKSLRKSAKHRYQTAEALRDDIERYFDGFPVTARRDSLVYRTERFIRRHWVTVLTVLLIVLGVALAWRNSTGLATRLRNQLRQAEIFLAYKERQEGNLSSSNSLLEKWGAPHYPLKQAGFAWQLLNYLNREDSAKNIDLGEQVKAVRFHVRGESLAFLKDNHIYSFCLNTQKQQRLCDLPANGLANGVPSFLFDEKGNRVAVSTMGAEESRIDLIDIAEQLRHVIPIPGRFAAMQFTDNGAWLAIGDSLGYVRIVNAKTGQVVQAISVFDDNPCSTLAFSPDGRRLAVSSLKNNSLKVFSMPNLYDSAGFTQATYKMGASTLFFSRNSDVLFISDGQAVYRLDASSGGNIVNVLPDADDYGIKAVRIADDQKTIALATMDGRIFVFRAKPHAASEYLAWKRIFAYRQTMEVDSIGFLRDGRTIVMSTDGAVVHDSFHETSRWKSVYESIESPFSWMDSADVSLDGKAAAYVDRQGAVLWDFDTETRVRLSSPVTEFKQFAISEAYVAGCTHFGKLVIWDRRQGVMLHPVISASDIELTAVDLNEETRRIVVAGEGHLSIWDLDTGNELWRSDDQGLRWCDYVEFVDDGNRLITAGGLHSSTAELGGPGYVRIWDTPTPPNSPAIIREFKIPGRILCGSVSPDKTVLAVGGWGKSINLIDLRTLKQVNAIQANAIVHSLTFHPSEPILLSATFGRLKVRNYPELAELGSVRREFHTGTVRLIRHPQHGIGLFNFGPERCRVRWMEQPDHPR